MRANLLKFIMVLNCLCLGAMAADHTGNINKGNVEVYGSTTVNLQLSGTAKTNYFSVNTGVQYFLIDRLSLGGAFGYDMETGVDDVALAGPGATYYFFAQGPFAAYAGINYRFGLTNATLKGRLDTEIGAKYFFTPSVAFGPYIDYQYRVRRSADNESRLLFGANFALYL